VLNRIITERHFEYFFDRLESELQQALVHVWPSFKQCPPKRKAAVPIVPSVPAAAQVDPPPEESVPPPEHPAKRITLNSDKPVVPSESNMRKVFISVMAEQVRFHRQSADNVPRGHFGGYRSVRHPPPRRIRCSGGGPRLTSRQVKT
jgi:hypothetical protein